MKIELAEKLIACENTIIRAFVGLDGFIDEVVHVVDKRLCPDTFDRVKTLKAYGERIAASSGLSSNVEMVSVDRKLGGNGPIFALSLKKLNANITYMGCVGVDTYDNVFSELVEGSDIIGIGQPSHTDAIEFDDGKIISSKLNSLNSLLWSDITNKISPQNLAQIFDKMHLISLNNWTMIPAMNDIWKHIIDDVLPLMNSSLGDKVLFLDIADPEKRDRKDILEALELMGKFEDAGLKTVLGLNKKEACEIAELFGQTFTAKESSNLKDLVEFLSLKLRVSCIVVHPADSAGCVKNGVYYEIEGPYCSQPKLLTGAGDNFNSGFIFGYVQGFDISQCLLAGVACSGYYVRECKSPSTKELSEFLKKWDAGQLI